MRTKTIIDGFKNSQKFRFILLAESGEEVGMVITISQMSEQFATRNARMSVWSALSRLAIDRRMAEVRGETKPSGIVTDAFGFRQVQVDLH
jgi:hypothetical protein